MKRPVRQLMLSAAAAAAALSAVGSPAPAAFAATTDSNPNREAAIVFIDLAINKKQPEAALREYAGDSYTEHDQLAPDGKHGFTRRQSLSGAVFPQSHQRVFRSMAEGAFVVLMSQVTPLSAQRSSPSQGLAKIDVFRFDGQGKIVEHWAVSQPVVPVSAQEVDTFSGPDVGPLHGSSLSANKATAAAFLDLAMNQRKPQEAVDAYVGATYTNHNQFAAPGKQGFVQSLTLTGTILFQQHQEVVRSWARGDMVVTYSHVALLDGQRGRQDQGMALVDWFRFDDRGKIVEHWDVFQPVLPAGLNDNPLFFE